LKIVTLALGHIHLSSINQTIHLCVQLLVYSGLKLPRIFHFHSFKDLGHSIDSKKLGTVFIELLFILTKVQISTQVVNLKIYVKIIGKISSKNRCMNKLFIRLLQSVPLNLRRIRTSRELTDQIHVM
jgi:hypothetical protein